ncbi:MAG: U32 family peptidase [Bacteroidales bacterium]|nr:U32 family peptidase [Bacteroidales bacterium]
MAPAGSYGAMTAAIKAGADSVYFGVGRLNMRSRSSQRFTMRDLGKIISTCRDSGVRAYLALNTVVYDGELRQMRRIVDSAAEKGIDAIIATDPAVLQYAASMGVRVHISTQSSISNIEAVRFYSAFADVMVLARELNLHQVATITRTIQREKITGPSGEQVRIELFAHGALCMAISGKCYLSLDTMNAPANRGSCFQICRRPYRVYDADGEIELLIDNEYIMSPKDLKTVHFLDKIIRAGVTILKIEGRGRPADYVKTVTEVYREAVDACHDGTYNAERIVEWDRRLATVFNRGFWDGYYLGARLGEWSDVNGSKATLRKTYAGKVVNYYTKLGVAAVRLDAADLNLGEAVMFIGATTGAYNTRVTGLRVEESNVEKAEKGVICSIPVDAPVRKGDKMFKVTPRRL